MKKVYVTITGMKYYYGFNPFTVQHRQKIDMQKGTQQPV